MRFSGERQAPAPVTQVWGALHDRQTLLAVIPGCEEMVPRGAGRYDATLRARVGPVGDTYRGSFTIEDLRPGAELRVQVEAGGRCGRLLVDLRVALAQAEGPDITALRYVADATVGGFVARLGAATLTVAGGHFTGCFFDGLDRVLRGARQPALLS